MGSIEETVSGISLELETSGSIFSPRGLDRGTLAMLSAVDFAPDDRVLDLGCGYGVVGLLAARLIGADRVVLIDCSAEAIRLARRNARTNGVDGVTIEQSDGLEGTRQTGFTKILCNPPYHEDFAVPKRFIEKGFNRLAVGGRLYMVTRRRRWYENKLRSIFGGVSVSVTDGYHVLWAEKRRGRYANRNPIR